MVHFSFGNEDAYLASWSVSGREVGVEENIEKHMAFACDLCLIKSLIIASFVSQGSWRQTNDSSEQPTSQCISQSYASVASPGPLTANKRLLSAVFVLHNTSLIMHQLVAIVWLLCMIWIIALFFNALEIVHVSGVKRLSNDIIWTPWTMYNVKLVEN